MKIRSDYVTNSSSSSFILSFKDEESVYNTLKEQFPKYIENGWSIEVIRLIANYYYKVKYKINGRFDECDKLLFANFETRKKCKF